MRALCHRIWRLLFGVWVFSSAAWAWPALGTGPVEIEGLEDVFAGRDTVVYVEDLETGLSYAANVSKVTERHAPWSSFKIPHMLIALETGVVSNLNSMIAYDPKRRPRASYWPDNWAQDQTLETAFKRSAAWYFQDLVPLIGAEKYAGYLDHFDYGNRQTPAGNDSFWLGGPLKVSPKEQVDFLRQLLTEQLEVAPLNVILLESVSTLRSDDGFVLHGKTGSGPLKSGQFSGAFEGWFVGWLERPGKKPVVFALWTQAGSYREISKYRRSATEEILKRLDFLPLRW